MNRPITRITVLFLVSLVAPAAIRAAPRADGELTIEVVDAKSGQPIAARMHLKNARGRPVKLDLPKIDQFAGHFYIDGQIVLPLRRGQYTFEIESGPEYLNQTGHFEIERRADDTKRVEMKRFVDLAKEGWWGGDLHVDRKIRDLPLVLRTEGLQDILFTDHATFLPETSQQPAPEGSQPKIRIARTPYAWELPVWLARDEVDAIQLIHHHALRDGVLDNEDDGRPRDRSLFPGRSGNGRWSESVYYHLLNCGLRIPPAAGSGSGMNENPVGANRVYAYCGDEFSPDAWWEALQAGEVFVTNGPLLRPQVEGRPPGYVFRMDSAGPLTLEIGLNLATRIPIEYLQVIRNGRVELEVRLADWKDREGRMPPLVVEDSGWFLVRAVTNNQKAFQLASSGPYYVERGGKPFISRTSVSFFLDWINAAKARIESMNSLDDQSRQALLADQDMARQFFENLLTQANAD